MDEFIHNFLEKHQKLEFKKYVLEQLNKLYVNSVSSLTSLPSHGWEAIERYMGPVVTPLLQREVEQKRKTKKEKIKRTRAESDADIHKIRRFLHYETKIKNSLTGKLEIDEYGYLDPIALENGFEEQRNDTEFDAGTVLDEIKTHLEVFSKPKMPLVKPSHGMILVSR